MTLKNKTEWYFFLIRFTIPLILVSVLWSTPGFERMILAFLILSFVDFSGGIVQFVWQPQMVDYRFAVTRDCVYALGFYFFSLMNPDISALILVPSVLAEIFVLFGHRAFFKAVLGETLLLIARMTTVHRIYHTVHPEWALLICTASIVMGLLGLVITVLEDLQDARARYQEELKGTLTELLALSLSPNGIDEELLQQESFSQMIDGFCRDTCQSKGRELGQQLANVISMKQAASHLLTSREVEVLLLMSEKQSYGQIARHLQVSEGTIRAHAASIMRKADVHSRDELIEWGRKNCLIPYIDGSIQTPHSSPNLIHS